MSAPTSLSQSASTGINLSPAAKEQQQQLIDNLYANTFNSETCDLSSMNGLKSQLKRSSSNKQVQPKQYATNASLSLSKSGNHLNSLNVVDNKFDELAEKIMSELRQAQYARDFFKVLDEIIREPIAKTYSSAVQQHHRHNANKLLRNRLRNRNPGNAATPTASSQNQLGGLNGSPVSRVILSKQHQQQSRQSNQQVFADNRTVAEPAGQQALAPSPASSTPSPQPSQVYGDSRTNQQSKSRSAIPTSTITIAASKSATCSPWKLSDIQPAAMGQPCVNQIKKSATIADASVLVSQPAAGGNFKRQPSLRKSSTTTTQQTISTGQPIERPAVSHQASGSGSDDDGDDDDDEDYYYRCYNVDKNRPVTNAQQAAAYYHNRHQAQAPKSKNSITSETSSLPAESHATRQQSTKVSSPDSQQQQVALKQQRQRLSPLVRSNTIGAGQSSATNANASSSTHDNHEPRSLILNGRDPSSLYKPHMNYSTSLLGNHHRLSDDDEIIIIPTQSPSLMSPSPDYMGHRHEQTNDGEGGEGDELIERFSISRTKSFWEKLSKGGNGKRKDATGLSLQQTGVTSNNDASSKSGFALDNQHSIKKQTQAGGGSSKQQLMGVRFANGRSTASPGGNPAAGNQSNFDRMDSTGGSNSNYSCSSSGDENCTSTGSSSVKNPTIAKLQELSRQNRLRQTR